MTIKIKQVCVKATAEDGVCILGPRGVSKENLIVDEWMQEVASSKKLRKWFNHRPERFEVFTAKYLEALAMNEEPLHKWKEMISNATGDVTLVYGSKEEQYNQAVVLKAY